MKRKKGFHLHDICGERILIAEGEENIDFSDIISMNATSAYLWEAVGDADFTADTLAGLLTDKYEVDAATALADSHTLISQWQEAGVIE